MVRASIINEMCQSYVCPLTATYCTGNNCPCLEAEYKDKDLNIYCACYSLAGNGRFKLGVVANDIDANPSNEYIYTKEEFDELMLRLP